MALYRLLFLRDGEVVGHLSRDCADDHDAHEAAWQVSDEYTVEVYLGKRLVGRVERRADSNVPGSGYSP